MAVLEKRHSLDEKKPGLASQPRWSPLLPRHRPELPCRPRIPVRCTQHWGFPGAEELRDPGWSLSQEDSLEQGMATHCSIPAWRIPQTEDPGGLQSVGSHRVGLDRSDLARTHTRHTTLL